MLLRTPLYGLLRVGIWGLGARAWDWELRVLGFSFRAHGFGFGVQGLGLRARAERISTIFRAFNAERKALYYRGPKIQGFRGSGLRNIFESKAKVASFVVTLLDPAEGISLCRLEHGGLNSYLNPPNLLFCRVPIKFVLGFIIRTYKK